MGAPCSRTQVISRKDGDMFDRRHEESIGCMDAHLEIQRFLTGDTAQITQRT